ncbi:unnamed protein product [Caenorhabditis angaria]|uniref:Uncharacterized protein n=1 Tax=Caenorhabditis angaria TaxID=860376 RepID=A0A9P1IM57_9PELO|nr:unnamed protein product [Caenorhabditis angaria]
MKILKLSIDDIYIIDMPILEALFGHTSPISTPYGTFCRLALNSFIMLFDEVTNGMNLFRRGGLKKENFPKIIEWFTNFTKDDQLFSANRNQRFLIETWKLEEIIDRAYIELEQFMTDPIQKLPKPPIEISYALKELCKWSEDCEDVCYQIKLAIEGDIHSGLSFNILLEHRRYVFNYILTKHSKIDKFCANQGFFLKVRYTSNPVADTKPVQVSASEMMKLREEEFMKILPTIPLHFEMTCKQLHKKIEENISKRGPVWYECEIEDQRKNLELFDKFMEFIDVAITKEHECYVKRKLIPSKREKIYHDSLFSDKKLLNTVLFQGGPFLKAYRERLEEIMYETDNEEVVKSITNALKNFEMFNFEPPV